MVSTLFYVVFFAVGPGSIPWMITAELFSQVDDDDDDDDDYDDDVDDDDNDDNDYDNEHFTPARKVITLVKQGCPAGITSSISFTDSHPAPYMRATTLSKSSVTYHLLFLNKVHIKFHTKCAFIKYQVLQIILTPCHTSENSLKMR